MTGYEHYQAGEAALAKAENDYMPSPSAVFQWLQIAQTHFMAAQVTLEAERKLGPTSIVRFSN